MYAVILVAMILGADEYPPISSDAETLQQFVSGYNGSSSPVAELPADISVETVYALRYQIQEKQIELREAADLYQKMDIRKEIAAIKRKMEMVQNILVRQNRITSRQNRPQTQSFDLVGYHQAIAANYTMWTFNNSIAASYYIPIYRPQYYSHSYSYRHQRRFKCWCFLGRKTNR